MPIIPQSRSPESSSRRIRRNCRWLIAAAASVIGSTSVTIGATPAQSAWVQIDAAGKLHYKTTAAGDRIMDFSAAGYMGGGVALPDVPAKATVHPTGTEDDTAAIQAAIDTVAALPMHDGFRGAVLLTPGVFTCARTLTLTASGVVLRGCGATGANATTIKMVGPRHIAIVIGSGRRAPVLRPPSDDDDPAAPATDRTAAEPRAIRTTIADAYVPSGGRSFTVVDAKGFAVGDNIAIRRPTTAAWVHLMEMDNLKRERRPQTWIGENRAGITERKITAISGNTVTLDLPLADSYDAKFLNPLGTAVVKITPAATVTQVGVEHLHLQCPPLEISYGNAPYAGIRVGGNDCWVRDVYCEETMNTTTLAGKRITMEQIVVTHTFPNLGASKPTDFSIEGSQILIDRCAVTGGNTYFVWCGSLEPGPNVILNSTFRGHGSRIQPHMRWSTGLLVDNCTVPDGGIDFMNRGVAGSGHGWTMGWAVAWNCIADAYVIQNPPGAANWAIGCIGTRVQTGRMFDRTPLQPEGIFDAHGTPVAPQSLYLAQLAERLGPPGLRAVGYAANTEQQFPNKSVARLAPLPRNVDPMLGPDLAQNRPVNTSGVRGRTREFGGERALDGNPQTYWATNDGVTHATFEVDLEGPVEISALVLEEPANLHAARHYKVEGMGTSDWELLAEGTTIGERQVHRFAPTTVWKVRLTVLDAQPYPALGKFGLFLVK
jgi:hypothetical protein